MKLCNDNVVAHTLAHTLVLYMLTVDSNEFYWSNELKATWVNSNTNNNIANLRQYPIEYHWPD